MSDWNTEVATWQRTVCSWRKTAHHQYQQFSTDLYLLDFRSSRVCD